jgi:hypothetical protein
MKVEQRNWNEASGWQTTSTASVSNPQFVLAFGSREQLGNAERYNELKSAYPNADIVIGTTSGEIQDVKVTDDTIVVSAVEFEKTTTKAVSVKIEDFKNSYEAGAELVKQLKAIDGLAHVFVLSEGIKVNGSELTRGMSENLPTNISVTGGLAGDAARFEQTLVGLNVTPSPGNIVAIGFYGSSLKVGYGSVGGWDYFGADRLVTKSKSNVLYELDGQSALELYKMYLGEKAKELPGSALLFPLGMKYHEDSDSVVRTVLGIDEKANSMTFAGDIPEGSYVRLMKANFEKLIDGAGAAATNSSETMGNNCEFAILISCVGRKLVLDQRIEEEVEAVRDILGPQPALTGFYSYGEISPIITHAKCELHNQTMTITTFSEG